LVDPGARLNAVKSSSISAVYADSILAGSAQGTIKNIDVHKYIGSLSPRIRNKFGRADSSAIGVGWVLFPIFEGDGKSTGYKST
jgi:hypothetical protein